jgi:hypothetical protein
MQAARLDNPLVSISVLLGGLSGHSTERQRARPGYHAVLLSLDADVLDYLCPERVLFLS